MQCADLFPAKGQPKIRLKELAGTAMRFGRGIRPSSTISSNLVTRARGRAGQARAEGYRGGSGPSPFFVIKSQYSGITSLAFLTLHRWQHQTRSARTVSPMDLQLIKILAVFFSMLQLGSTRGLLYFRRSSTSPPRIIVPSRRRHLNAKADRRRFSW